MTGEHIRGIPRTYEKEITLADTPYTLSVGFNCVKVDTTGGNVRVNLPDTNYPIDVIKTSSDAYIVTVWVGGTQIGEIAGELSKITVESAEVTKDEPWFPYDAIVGIAGVSGDGGEVLAKDRYGKVITGGRGVAGTDDRSVIQSALDGYSEICLRGNTFWLNGASRIPSFRKLFGIGDSTVLKLLNNINTNVIENYDQTNGNNYIRIQDLRIDGNRANNMIGHGIYLTRPSIAGFMTLIENVRVFYSPQDGIYLNNTTVVELHHTLSNYSGRYGYNIAGTDLHAYDLQAGYNDYFGVRIATSYNHISGIEVWQNGAANPGFGKDGIYIYGNACTISGGGGVDYNVGDGIGIYGNDNVVSGIRLHSNGNDGVSYTPTAFGVRIYGSHNIIENCYFNDVASAPLGGHQTSSIVESALLSPDYNMIRNNNVISRTGGPAIAILGIHTVVENNFGYPTESSDSSTGTGSEQTIPHGLAAIPTGCKAWITYLVGTRYVTEMIPFDATNVYPTVDNGVAYTWRIE